MDYKDLEVWQSAHTLAINVERRTLDAGRRALDGFTTSVQRLSPSVQHAEGQSRYGSAEFARFVHMAAGSAAELEAELLIARDLDYLTEEHHKWLQAILTSIRKQLTVLASRLTSNAQRPATGAKR